MFIYDCYIAITQFEYLSLDWRNNMNVAFVISLFSLQSLRDFHVHKNKVRTRKIARANKALCRLVLQWDFYCITYFFFLQVFSLEWQITWWELRNEHCISTCQSDLSTRKTHTNCLTLQRHEPMLDLYQIYKCRWTRNALRL